MDFVACGVAEAANEQRAGDFDVVLRLFRMQRGQLAELGQRAGDVAGVQLGLSDEIEADDGRLHVEDFLHRGARLFKIRRADAARTAVEAQHREDGAVRLRRELFAQRGRAELRGLVRRQRAHGVAVRANPGAQLAPCQRR